MGALGTGGKDRLYHIESHFRNEVLAIVNRGEVEGLKVVDDEWITDGQNWLHVWDEQHVYGWGGNKEAGIIRALREQGVVIAFKEALEK